MDVRPLRGSLGKAAFERLREGIAGGKWAPGERLPSERALARQKGVADGSRLTDRDHRGSEGLGAQSTGSKCCRTGS